MTLRVTTKDENDPPGVSTQFQPLTIIFEGDISPLLLSIRVLNEGAKPITSGLLTIWEQSKIQIAASNRPQGWALS